MYSVLREPAAFQEPSLCANGSDLAWVARLVVVEGLSSDRKAQAVALRGCIDLINGGVCEQPSLFDAHWHTIAIHDDHIEISRIWIGGTNPVSSNFEV
ncbi:uncharacterized protein VTP21DRAFT_2231 [Calcarisporiella thermophila]|uniref:uncharacterized protein n=1 Tax=Calcarisporiella thermophila TaxID=911321 RepID=UPI003742109E